MKCRLRMVEAEYIYRSNGSGSVLSIEYGKYYKKTSKSTMHRIYYADPNHFRKKATNLMQVIYNFQRKPFSKFIQTVGHFIKAKCLKDAHVISTSQKRRPNSSDRFIVIHLRGTDRPCALEQLRPEALMFKITRLGIKRESDVIYLMSDLNDTSRHIQAIQHFFGDYYLFQAKDMDVFDHEVFAEKAPFLIYAIENYLQQIADGVIITYKGHNLRRHDNIMGHLSDEKC